jgi:hypothetical protein
MVKQFTVIRFTQVGRGSARGLTRHVWVKECRFKDGPGYQVKSVTYTTERTEAARFSVVVATEIASQYYTSPATLERPDGTAMPEATKELQAECFRRNAEAIRNRAEIAREWAAFWNDMPADLRTSLRGLGLNI